MSEWKQRMTLIRPYLDQYHRRFSVLDLGCGDGQIARAIAREYDAVVTVVEKGLGDTEEYGLHHYEGVPRIIGIKHQFTADELVGLDACEYFDVVLALNFLHWFTKDDWRDALAAVIRMGRKVFIQLPPKGTRGCPGDDYLDELVDELGMLSRLGKTVQFPGHTPRPLWMVAHPAPKFLISSVMFDKDGSVPALRGYPVEVRWNDSGVWAKDRDWIQGINLWNWIKLGGVLPSKDRVIELLDRVEIVGHHGDVVPWNFILDGERVHLIDGYEGWGGDDQRGLDAVKEAVRNAIPCRQYR